MRRQLFYFGISMTMVFALAGCKKNEPSDALPDHARRSVQIAPSTATSPAPQPAASGRTVSEENESYTFSYAYPAQAAAIPGLKAYLDTDITEQRAKLATEAKDGKEEAKTGGYDFHLYEQGTQWQLVADLPGWLSLSANVYSYEGGAHPNHWFDALLWDKAANKRLSASDLFVTKQALSKAIRQPFCTALNKERSKRRGEPVRQGGDDLFSACIDPIDEIVILGSVDHKHFTRIGILVPPYDAGPYAEGDYEVTLPITPAVLAAVKPEFKASFAVGR